MGPVGWGVHQQRGALSLQLQARKPQRPAVAASYCASHLLQVCKQRVDDGETISLFVPVSFKLPRYRLSVCTLAKAAVARTCAPNALT